jgi:hypothetical protein
MGYTAIPGGDIWLQIGTTQTPTSGSAVTFTNIPAVKKLRLVVQNVSLTAAGYISVTLNNDATANYNQNQISDTSTTTRALGGILSNIQATRLAGASAHISDFIVDYANQACPKLITGFGSNNTAATAYYGITTTWNSTATVNRVDFTTGSTFNATNTGTIAIYGAF